MRKILLLWQNIFWNTSWRYGNWLFSGGQLIVFVLILQVIWICWRAHWGSCLIRTGDQQTGASHLLLQYLFSPQWKWSYDLQKWPLHNISSNQHTLRCCNNMVVVPIRYLMDGFVSMINFCWVPFFRVSWVAVIFCIISNNYESLCLFHIYCCIMLLYLFTVCILHSIQSIGHMR